MARKKQLADAAPVAVNVETPEAEKIKAEAIAEAREKAEAKDTADEKAEKAKAGAVKALAKGEGDYLHGMIVAGRLAHEYCRWFMSADPSRQRSNAVQTLVAAFAPHASVPVSPAWVDRMMKASAAYDLLTDKGKTDAAKGLPYGIFSEAYVQFVERVNANTGSESFALLPGAETECCTFFAAKAEALTTVSEHVNAVRLFMAEYHSRTAEAKAKEEEKAAKDKEAAEKAERMAREAAEKAKAEAEAAAKAAKDAKDAEERKALTEKAKEAEELAREAAKAEKAAHNAATIADKAAARAEEETKRAYDKAEAARLAAENKPRPRKDSAASGSNLMPGARKDANPKDVADMALAFIFENGAPSECLKQLLVKAKNDKRFPANVARALEVALIHWNRAESESSKSAVA